MNRKNKLSTHSFVVLFICGIIGVEFNILQFMYQIAKFCESKFSLILNDYSDQLKNLFKFKWNVINLFNFIIYYLINTLSYLNKDNTTSLYEISIIKSLRLFLDYKVYDFESTLSILKVHLNDNSF